MPRRQQSITIYCLNVALIICHGADAAPHSGPNKYALQRREGDSSSPTQPSGITAQVWAPLVAITLVIIIMIVFSCIKRRRQTAFLVAARANNGVNGELTAELLSGSSGEVTTTNRRPRRTRRTPSQISTRSLPAYMEDPGDSEMVLVRSAREMQDPMPTVQEGDVGHNTSASLRSLGELSNASQNIHTNLLGRESHQPQPEGETRPSFDTVRTAGSEDDHRPLLQPSGHSRQPSAEEILAMGEAPPYFEVVSEVDLTEGIEMHGMGPAAGPSTTSDATQTPSDIREVATPEPAHTRDATSTSTVSASTIRRLGFHSFAARLSQFISSSSSSQPSSPATHPESQTADGTTVQNDTRHRSSNSGSGLNTTLTHTVSHPSRYNRSLRSNPSAVNLTSPSVTSLGPISAPLPHTLVRTEFEYPRGGPSSEQMKFISSRETLGKFSVPYGLAAQAQALASREAVAMSLDTEPPPFESPVAEAGPSAARPAGDNVVASPSRADGLVHAPASAALTPPIDLPAVEPPGSAASDTFSSRSSNRDSDLTFMTAAEALSSAEDDPKDEEHADLELESRSPTPTLAHGPLTINIEGVTKSVPTPPPTPPRQSLSLPGTNIPTIIVAPSSPAT